MFGNNNVIRFTKITFIIVAIPMLIIGIKKPETITTFEKNPKIYPIIVRITQLNPKGEPEIKSNKIPEVKPEISPEILPFINERKTEQINNKSGTTYKNEIFDKIADSIIAAQKRIKILNKTDFPNFILLK